MTVEDEDTSIREDTSAPAVNDPFQPVLDNDAQLAALTRAVQYSDDFSLYFAVCNSNSTRADLMKRLREAAPEKSFADIDCYEPVENLYHDLARRLDVNSPAAAQPDVVVVYGLEAWLPSGFDGENSPFVKNLNAARNHFSLILKGPLILWLSEHHLESIAQGAPDFCSVRSGGYTFVGEREEMGAMQKAVDILGLEGIAGLPLEDKQRRLEDIEQMLTEIQQQPEEERDVQREQRLLRTAFEMYYAMAQYDKAEPLIRRLLNVSENVHDSNHPQIAVDLANMASLLHDTNRLSEAEPLLRRALKIDEESYGPDHPRVAVDLNDLALLLSARGRPSEAEPMMRRALRIHEATSGPDHPAVAVSLTNLGLLLQAVDRASDEERLVFRRHEVDESTSTPKLPDVGIDPTKINERPTDPLLEAEMLMRRAVEVGEAAHVPEHPNVAAYLNNLAQLLESTGRLSEAEPLIRRGLAINEASFGPNHPNVAVLLQNLAMMEFAKGHRDEAREMLERSLRIFRENLGNDEHPYIQAALAHLRTVTDEAN